MNIVNKILDFALTETGQAICLAILSFMSVKGWLNISPAQAEESVKLAEEHRGPDGKIDGKGLAKAAKKKVFKNLIDSFLKKSKLR